MTQPVDRVWVFDPNGNLGSIPSERLGEALANGYRAPGSKEEVYAGKQKADVAAESETLLGQTQAFGESALSGATLGLSDAVLRDVKGKDYAQRAALRRETGAGQTGEIVGAVAPALVSGGASLPAGAAAKLGAGAGRLIEQQVARGVGKSALGRIGSKAAGYGAEGGLTAAAQQMGSNIGEASLTDEELTAEQLLAGVDEAVLYGAGFGALLGGGIGAGKEVARKVYAPVDSARRVGGRISQASDTVTGTDALEGAAGALESLGGLPGGMSNLIDPITGTMQAGRGALRASGKSGGDILQSASEAYASALGKTKADKAVLKRVLTERSARQDYLVRDELRDEVVRRAKPLVDSANEADDALRQAIEEAAPTLKANAIAPEESILRAKAKASAIGKEVLADLAGNSSGVIPSKIERKIISEVSKSVVGSSMAKTAPEMIESLSSASKRMADLAAKTDSPRLSELLAAKADELRAAADDPEIWGPSAGVRRRLEESMGAATTTQPAYQRALGSGDVDGYLRSVRPNSDDHKQIVQHLIAKDEALTAALDSGALAPKTVKTVEKARDNVRSLAETMSSEGDRIAQANALEDIVSAEKTGFFGRYPEAAALGAGLVAGPGAYMSTKIIGALARPGTLATQIAAIESVVQRAASIKRSADSAVRSMVMGKRGSRLNAKTRSSVPVNLFGDSPTERRKSYRKRAKQIQQLGTDPEQLIYAMQRITEGLEQPAPSLTAQISAQHARSVAYLADNLPRPPDYIKSNAAREEWMPSSPEITAFERRYRAVSDPMSVIEDARTGNLTPEAVEALKATKPKLWEAMRLTAMEAVADADHQVDYNVTVQLAMLFDFAAAPTLDPSFMFAHQEMMAARVAEQEEQAQSQKPQTGPLPETFSTQSATLSERVASNT
jgi:hypothetical protein